MLPHVPDAWIDHEQDQDRLRDPAQPALLPLRAAAPLEDIEADMRKLEGEIVSLLSEIAA